MHSEARPERVVPVVAEELEVDKRVVETGRVVVRKRVEEIVQHAPLAALLREDVDVQRVPVNRVVNAPQPVRQDGDVTIVPVHEEVVTVQLVLKEELHLRRRRTHAEAAPQEVTLRRETVEVVRAPPEPDADA